MNPEKRYLLYLLKKTVLVITTILHIVLFYINICGLYESQATPLGIVLTILMFFSFFVLTFLTADKNWFFITITVFYVLAIVSAPLISIVFAEKNILLWYIFGFFLLNFVNPTLTILYICGHMFFNALETVGMPNWLAIIVWATISYLIFVIMWISFKIVYKRIKFKKEAKLCQNSNL